MQLFVFLSIILACIVAAAAVPLGLEVVRDKFDTSLDTPPPSKKQKDGMKIVNGQFPKMHATLTAAEEGDVDAQERVRLAFGPKGVDQIPTIKQKIQTIEDGTLRISSLQAAAVDKLRGTKKFPKINAYTPWDPPTDTEPVKTHPVEFGGNFNSKEVKAPEAASTLLHEAAHQIVHASDDSYRQKADGTPPKMVPLGVTAPEDQVEELKGYANHNPVLGSEGNPITEAHLSDTFKELRDSATDMHNNADSYALFGAICDVPRRLKRALLDDDPVAYYLAKRAAASCKPPSDSFKKKAAAQAAKKQAASMSSPASKSGVAKATSKNAAGVGSGRQKTTKGGKPRAVSQSALKTLGKATKSARPNTAKSGVSKGSLKGSKARVPTSRGKPSKSSTSRLSSKTSKGALKGSKATIPTSRGRLSNSRTSRLSSKGSKGALKGSMSKSLKAKASRPLSKTSKVKTSKPLSKSSKSTRPKAVKASVPRGSPKKALKYKASKLGSPRDVPKKGTKSRVTSANGSSSKKGAAGAAKQTKRPSIRSPVSQGKQTSKQSSTLSNPKSTKTRSSEAAAVRPKVIRTKASAPVQKAPVSTAPKVVKALSKSVVDPLMVAAASKKKNGKP